MFEKLKFWKPKKDPLMQGRDLGTMHVGPGMTKDELGISSEYDYQQPTGFTQDPFQQSFGQQGYGQFQQQQNPQQRQQQAQQMYHQQQPILVRELDHTGLQQQATIQPSSRDLELVSAKLDSLRVTLDMINQRLNVIEKELQNRHRGW